MSFISQARMFHACPFSSIILYVFGLILTHLLMFDPTVSTSGMIFPGMTPTEVGSLPLVLYLSHCIIIII